MPVDRGNNYDRDMSRRRFAWEQHYIGKGCTIQKAHEVAYAKVRRSSTWPPGKQQ